MKATMVLKRMSIYFQEKLSEHVQIYAFSTKYLSDADSDLSEVLCWSDWNFLFSYFHSVMKTTPVCDITDEVFCLLQNFAREERVADVIGDVKNRMRFYNKFWLCRLFVDDFPRAKENF